MRASIIVLLCALAVASAGSMGINWYNNSNFGIPTIDPCAANCTGSTICFAGDPPSGFSTYRVICSRRSNVTVNLALTLSGNNGNGYGTLWIGAINSTDVMYANWYSTPMNVVLSPATSNRLYLSKLLHGQNTQVSFSNQMGSSMEVTDQYYAWNNAQFTSAASTVVLDGAIGMDASSSFTAYNLKTGPSSVANINSAGSTFTVTNEYVSQGLVNLAGATVNLNGPQNYMFSSPGFTGNSWTGNGNINANSLTMQAPFNMLGSGGALNVVTGSLTTAPAVATHKRDSATDLANAIIAINSAQFTCNGPVTVVASPVNANLGRKVQDFKRTNGTQTQSNVGVALHVIGGSIFTIGSRGYFSPSLGSTQLANNFAARVDCQSTVYLPYGVIQSGNQSNVTATAQVLSNNVTCSGATVKTN